MCHFSFHPILISSVGTLNEKKNSNKQGYLLRILHRYLISLILGENTTLFGFLFLRLLIFTSQNLSYNHPSFINFFECLNNYETDHIDQTSYSTSSLHLPTSISSQSNNLCNKCDRRIVHRNCHSITFLLLSQQL